MLHVTIIIGATGQTHILCTNSEQFGRSGRVQGRSNAEEMENGKQELVKVYEVHVQNGARGI